MSDKTREISRPGRGDFRREVVAADAAGYMPRPRNLRCGRRGQQHEIQHEAGRQSFHDGFHKQRVSLVMVDQRYSLTRNFRSQK